jgi:hypothetical protein
MIQNLAAKGMSAPTRWTRPVAVAQIVGKFAPDFPDVPADQALRGVRLVREAMSTLTPIPVIYMSARRADGFAELGALKTGRDYVHRFIGLGYPRSEDFEDIVFASVQFMEGPDVVAGVRALQREWVGLANYGPVGVVLDPATMQRATVTPEVIARSHLVGGREHLAELMARRFGNREHLHDMLTLDDKQAVQRLRSYLLSDAYAWTPMEAHVRGVRLRDVHAVVLDAAGELGPTTKAAIPAAVRASRASGAPLLHKLDERGTATFEALVGA